MTSTVAGTDVQDTTIPCYVGSKDQSGMHYFNRVTKKSLKSYVEGI